MTGISRFQLRAQIRSRILRAISQPLSCQARGFRFQDVQGCARAPALLQRSSFCLKRFRRQAQSFRCIPTHPGVGTVQLGGGSVLRRKLLVWTLRIVIRSQSLLRSVRQHLVAVYSFGAGKPQRTTSLSVPGNRFETEAASPQASTSCRSATCSPSAGPAEWPDFLYKPSTVMVGALLANNHFIFGGISSFLTSY